MKQLLKNYNTIIHRFLKAIVFTGTLFSAAFAQNPPREELYKITQVSPNAASLGKYGEYPVGMYTGTPDISIPFYEVNSGRIKLPVNLSYHAGGIKVEEIASSAGLGWSLNAGGVVTRNVMGLPDEEQYIGGYTFLNPQYTVNQLIQMSGSSTNSAFITEQMKKILRLEVDGEPDVYYYNFGKYSGKFLYNQADQKYYTAPASPLRISFNDQPSNTSFTITDDNGLEYLFSATESSRRETGETTPPEVNITTGWFLSSIYDPVTKHSISFEYEDYEMNYTTMSSEAHYMPELYNFVSDVSSSSKQNTTYSLKRLTKITFDEGYLTFNYQLARCDLPGDYALTGVMLYDLNHTLIKSFGLSYDYYLSHSATPQNCSIAEAELKRLKLTAVTQYPSEGTGENQNYTFEYNETPLPSRLSKAQDHWGFYNGKNNNQHLYPPYISNNGAIQLDGGDRNVDPVYAKAGIISKITYPTKGFTTFNFESNTAASAALPPQTSSHIVQWMGGNDIAYYEEPFSLNNSCPPPSGQTQQGAYLTLSISELNMALIHAFGFPGVSIEVKVLNTDTSQESILFRVGGDKDIGDITQLPKAYYFPNGNYVFIVDCSANPFTETYMECRVRMTWTQCMPQTDMGGMNRYAGGLRIGRIANYSAQNVLTNVKSYKYVKENNSNETSGDTHFSPRYFTRVVYSETSGNPTDVDFVYMKRSSQSNYPLVAENGKSVGYSNVIEMNGDDDSNGYTQYSYTNFSDYNDVESTAYPNSLPISYQWLRGLERSRKIFKKEGTQNILVSETLTDYDTGLLGTAKKTIKGIRGSLMSTELDLPIEKRDTDPGATFIKPGWQEHPVYSDFVYAKKVSERSYTGSAYVETINEFTYNPRNFAPSVVQTTNTDGSKTITTTKYPLDFTVSNAVETKAKGIKTLQDLNYISAPVERYAEKKPVGTETRKLLGGNYYSYKETAPLADTIFSIKIPATDIQNYGGVAITAGSFTRLSDYKPEVILAKYAPDFNVLLEQKKHRGALHSYIWDHYNTRAVAEVTGAGSQDIAYTSFEADGKGNWSYQAGGTSDESAPAGKKICHLNSSLTISKTGLQASEQYMLSYWAKGADAATLSGGPARAAGTHNNWTLYERLISGVTQISLSGNADLDELRLYPSSATMTTFTFNPLVGMSSASDAKNQPTYYEYDNFQRLWQVRDTDRNIIKSYDYHLRP